MKFLSLFLLCLSPLLAGNVELNWTDNGTPANPVTGFEVERGIQAIPPAPQTWTRIATVTGTPLPTKYLDENVQPLTAYAYRVRATGPGGPSAYSNTAQAIGPVGPAAAPSGLTSTVKVAAEWASPPPGSTLVVEATMKNAGKK